MLKLKDLLFISNDHADYLRRLEIAYEKQQEEIERLKGLVKVLSKIDKPKLNKPMTSCDCIDWRDMSPSPFCHKCNGKGYY